MSNSVIGRRVHGPASPPAGVPPAPWVNGWAVSKRNPHQWVDPFRGLAGAPNQRKLRYRGRDGNRFPKQDDAGALRTSHLAIEMHWHRAAVLAHENSSRVRGDPQDLRILQPSESGVVRRTDVNSRRGPPQSAEYAAIKICVSLESDSHGAPAVASQSILHWSASTARVAIQQCTVLPQGRCRSLSGSPGSTQARRALVRGSRPGKNQPCSRPTSPRETNTQANQERLAYPQPDIALRRPSRILCASACPKIHGHTAKPPGTSGGGTWRQSRFTSSDVEILRLVRLRVLHHPRALRPRRTVTRRRLRAATGL